MRFEGTNKRPYEGQDLNALVASAILEVLKRNKHANARATHDFVLEEGPENLNLKNLSIKEE